MASSMNEQNEFGSVPGTGMTHLEEAMTHPGHVAGLWVASEGHVSLGSDEVISDPPVPNSIEGMSRV